MKLTKQQVAVLKDSISAKLDEAIEESGNDPEFAHGKADECLCEFLTLLGHADLVAKFNKVEKWYA